MHPLLLGLVAALSCAGGTAARAPAEGATNKVSVLWQSRVDGEIEPCG